jgi:hypothetical protein
LPEGRPLTVHNVTTALKVTKKLGAVSRPGTNRQFQFSEYISDVTAVNGLIDGPLYYFEMIARPSLRAERPRGARLDEAFCGLTRPRSALPRVVLQRSSPAVNQLLTTFAGSP